jgi:hypothetical protein
MRFDLPIRVQSYQTTNGTAVRRVCGDGHILNEFSL